MERKHFGVHLCQNWTGSSGRSFTNGIEVKLEYCVVALDPFSLVCVGRYKLTFTSEIAVLVNVSEIQV